MAAPKQSGAASASSKPRGRPRKSGSSVAAAAVEIPSEEEDEAMALAEAAAAAEQRQREAEPAGEDEEENSKSIPRELLTRLLHEFFEQGGSRITRDANAAVARYMDVFVREAIARAAAEREGGFLEVEDLEKVAPQLLLDL